MEGPRSQWAVVCNALSAPPWLLQVPTRLEVMLRHSSDPGRPNLLQDCAMHSTARLGQALACVRHWWVAPAAAAAAPNLFASATSSDAVTHSKGPSLHSCLQADNQGGRRHPALGHPCARADRQP